MDISFSKQVFDRVKKEKIIATVLVDNIEDALPLAEALYEGGIGCVELTLRTDCALKAIELISKRLPSVLVGAGTVLTSDQVTAVQDAGAHFAVSPGIDPLVLEKALDVKMPFSPGVMTPSDIQIALKYDYKNLKFFPSEPCGGIKFLKCMAAPYKHLGIRFLPLGGIHQDNFIDYFKEDLVMAVGGSWVAPRSKILDRDWTGIRNSSRLCRAKLIELDSSIADPKSVKQRIVSIDGSSKEVTVKKDLNQLTK